MHGEMMANPRAGLMTLVTQVNKAMNKRASEELLGMRLKQFLTLSYIQDHENVTQQALETALLVDATRAGKAARERADKARTALAEEMLAGFTQEERETLRSLLQRVLDSLLSATPEQVRR